jgi:hypothetical protein
MMLPAIARSAAAIDSHSQIADVEDENFKVLWV